MPAAITNVGLRTRLLLTHTLQRFGFSENSILLPLSLMVGVITAAAAVGFHLLIDGIRDFLYRTPEFLYGKGILLLVLFPALGGLIVGLVTSYVLRSREGHGVVDVMESVMRNSGVIKPLSALEKILTSAVTIGSGGSAGAEGPIVQIGAAIASGVGMFFQVARAHMPVLIGCGCAAGISAIFDSPIGGVLFTLEIILLDFSIRTFAPVVLASVIANVSTRAILLRVAPHSPNAIFAIPPSAILDISALAWRSVPNFLMLGLFCGVAGMCMTRLMYWTDDFFHRHPVPRPIRPALGGAAVGIGGVIYVITFGWVMLRRAKPFDFPNYPMPAFYGDGYGAVQQLFSAPFYEQFHLGQIVLLLSFLCVAKIIATCLTLGSGGSGGIIAPSLFLGATAGALLGVLLRAVHLNAGVEPGLYALIGMGAVLAAVVHAPLASILILVEVTDRHNIIVPAMLASVVATGTARLLFSDSIYTLALRRRGVRVGSSADLSILRRMIVEQVPLEPVTALPTDAPFDRLLELSQATSTTDIVILDTHGNYYGMVTANDINTALVQREAIPLLLTGDVARIELPLVHTGDDLAGVLEIFSRFEVGRLPVSIAQNSSRVIGVISRRALMSKYHDALSQS